jgi:hypothetical protein
MYARRESSLSREHHGHWGSIALSDGGDGGDGGERRGVRVAACSGLALALALVRLLLLVCENKHR